MSLTSRMDKLEKLLNDLEDSRQKVKEMEKAYDLIRAEYKEQRIELISLRGKVNQLINLLPKDQQLLFNFL